MSLKLYTLPCTLSQCRGLNTCCHAPLFTWVLGIQTQVFILALPTESFPWPLVGSFNNLFPLCLTVLFLGMCLDSHSKLGCGEVEGLFKTQECLLKVSRACSSEVEPVLTMKDAGPYPALEKLSSTVLHLLPPHPPLPPSLSFLWDQLGVLPRISAPRLV